MSYASEQAVLNSQWNAAQEANITEQARRAPHVLLPVRVTPDGNMWCCLYGEDLMVGVAGFGETPAQACAAFDEAWFSQKPPTMMKRAPHREVVAGREEMGDG
jgi:hypothetical protein